MLKVRSLAKAFGGLVVFDRIDLDIAAGSVVGLIGPNGAGKTTLFNVLTGFLRADAGRVEFLGREITAWPANRVFRAGIARTFQVVRPFAGLTCQENVRVAYEAKFGARGAAGASLEALARLGLADKAGRSVGELNLAEKRRLELARAIVSRPRLLMLDEVMAGLNPAELEEMIANIRRLREELELTVIAVEHIMQVIMSLSERILVLSQGRLLADGSPAEVAANPEVIAAYLGEDLDAQG